MEKVIALVWGSGDAESGDELRHQLIEDTLPRIHRGGARAATFNVHDTAAAAAPSPAPGPEGEPPHVAQISMWFDCYERWAEAEAALAALGLTTASYLVVESLYDDYGTTPYAAPRDWPDGERSPGEVPFRAVRAEVRTAGLEQEWTIPPTTPGRRRRQRGEAPHIGRRPRRHRRGIGALDLEDPG